MTHRSDSKVGARCSPCPFIGFNHVATLTTDIDLTVRFYEQVFDAVVTFEVPKRDDHPWMKILDLGGGATPVAFSVHGTRVPTPAGVGRGLHFPRGDMQSP